TLPTWPAGELGPDTQVLAKEVEFRAARCALDVHAQSEPPDPLCPETAGFSSEQLRQFCSILGEPEPEVDSRLEGITETKPVEDHLIQRVHTAIALWERRPLALKSSGPTAAEIRQEIDSLPIPRPGELQPDPDVLDAAKIYHSAKEALRHHQLNRPT